MTGPIAQRLTATLLASAHRRMGSTGPDWATAMLAEADICTSGSDRLRWAWGCWTASLRASCSLDGLIYAASLLAGLGLLSAYEWRADEGRPTIIMLGLLALALGALNPRRALLSGALLGLVVTGVIGFEAISGLRPAYEAHAQTLADSASWMALLAPALAASVTGARIGHRLRAAKAIP